MVEGWEQRLLRNEPVPGQYYERPELSLTDNYYMLAWNDLSTERPIGMAEGYLPRSKIKQYGIEDMGLNGEELDFFIRVIRSVDNEYLSEKSNSATSSSDPKMLDVVPSSDVAGTRSLLQRLAAPKGGRDRFTKTKKRVNHEGE